MYTPKQNYEIRDDARYYLRSALGEFWRIAAVYVAIVLVAEWLLELPFSKSFNAYEDYIAGALTPGSPVPKEIDFTAFYVYASLSYVLSIVCVPMLYGLLRVVSLDIRGINYGSPYRMLFEKYKSAKSFFKAIGISLLSAVKIFLWSLLLVVPGVIKGLSYSLVPFLMYDEPELSVSDTLKKSARIMNGYKGKLFMLYLSFLGWLILIPLTFGIAAIYVVPYMTASFAKFYDEVRRNYYNDDPTLNSESKYPSDADRPYKSNSDEKPFSEDNSPSDASDSPFSEFSGIGSSYSKNSDDKPFSD